MNQIKIDVIGENICIYKINAFKLKCESLLYSGLDHNINNQI